MIEGNAGRTFIRTAMRAPYLQREEEHDLALRWKEHHDQQALNRITLAHMRLVIAMAGKFRHFGLPVADLVQEGHVGLLEAAARFEPEREVRFSTYATWWIRASMQDYILRNWSIVRGGTSSAQKALFFNLRRLRARLANGAEPLSNEALYREVSVAVGVPEADVAMMDSRLSCPDSSLNAPLADENGAAERMDFLVSEDPLPDEIVGDRIDIASRRVFAGRGQDAADGEHHGLGLELRSAAAQGGHDAPPVGIAAEERGLDQGRVADGPRGQFGLGVALGAAHGDALAILVDDAHDHGIDPTAEITRDQSDRDADERRQQRSHDADSQRDAGAEGQPDEDVAAEMVGPHQMLPARRLRDRGVVLLGVGVGPDHRQKNRREREHDDEDARSERQPIAGEAAKCAAPQALGPDGCLGDFERFSCGDGCGHDGSVSVCGFNDRLLRHARIEKRIEQVDQQVDQRYDEAEQKHGAENDRVIARCDAIDEIAANAGHLVDRFDEKGTGDHVGQDDAADRQHRQHRIANRVANDDRPLGQAL